MTMYKVTAAAVVVVMTLSSEVFTNDVKNSSGMMVDKLNNNGYHQASAVGNKATPKNGMQDVIKGKKLDKYQTATIE